MDSTEENIKTGLEQENLKDLEITRKWAMFISILGFIGVGVLLIVGIFAVLFLCIFNKGDPLHPDYSLVHHFLYRQPAAMLHHRKMQGRELIIRLKLLNRNNPPAPLKGGKI